MRRAAPSGRERVHRMAGHPARRRKPSIEVERLAEGELTRPGLTDTAERRLELAARRRVGRVEHQQVGARTRRTSSAPRT
jgi:hypothetical protein